MMITLICNHSLALFSVVLLIIHSRSSDKFFPNEKNTEFEYNMVLCDGQNIADFSTWLYYVYIIIFENTYIFIICHKNGIIACLKKISSLELFGSVFLWLIIFVK